MYFIAIHKITLSYSPFNTAFASFNNTAAFATLKRISNWPLYKIRYYATYIITVS